MDLTLPDGWSFSLSVSLDVCFFDFTYLKDSDFPPLRWSCGATRECFDVVGFWKLLEINLQGLHREFGE